MTTANTLYTVLGVAPDAGSEEIDAIFRARELALQGQADELSLLRVAYATLRNADQRAAYDRKLAQQQQTVSLPRLSETDEVDFQPGRRARPDWLHWMLLLAAVGVIGSLLLKKLPPAPAETPVGRPVQAPVATLPPLAAAAPEPAASNAPADDSRAAMPVTIQDSPAQHETSVTILPSRGAKQAGFDSRYIAWSVFIIRQRDRSGSGVMIGPERILTNCHVLAGGASNGLVVIHSMTQQATKVEKYARLDGEDACLLFAPGAGNDSLAWGSSDSLRPGDTVHTMGHPGGSSSIIWSEGQFRMRVDRGRESVLVSNNYCRPGSSGGPLLDSEGRLVGVVSQVQVRARDREPVQYGDCISVPEASARVLLGKPLFPIALAPAQYLRND